MISRPVRAAAVAVVGALSLSACATQGYVDEQVAALNGRIDAVDARAQDAARRADAAAQAAQAAAAEARAANQRVDQMGARLDSMQQAPVRRTPRN